MRIGGISLLIWLLLGPSASMANYTCHPPILSSNDVDRLILETPDAERARRAGLHLKVIPSGSTPYAGDHPSLTRLLAAERGGALNNGILDYLTVDRVTGRVYDVNGKVIRSPALDQSVRRSLGRCI